MLPRCETGCPGFGADFARSSANGRFFSYSRLHERLVVGEHEPAAVAALVQLDRPRERAGLRVRVVVGRAVRDVQVGAHARVEAADRRGRVDSRVRDVQRVVRRRRLDLPAVRIEDQRAVRVVRDQELELEPVDQRLVRLRLGLRRGAGAAVVVGRELRRRALVVVAPVDVVVAVQVDAVVPGDLPVAVVVVEVLPPQPLRGRTCTGSRPGWRRAGTTARTC